MFLRKRIWKIFEPLGHYMSFDGGIEYILKYLVKEYIKSKNPEPEEEKERTHFFIYLKTGDMINFYGTYGNIFNGFIYFQEDEGNLGKTSRWFNTNEIIEVRSFKEEG